MNKLITTNNGGFPWVLDDIRWEQDAYREAIEDIAKGIQNSATADCVLWGGVITDNTTTFDITEGACIINGEIYHFEAQTGLTKQAAKYLILEPSTGTYDAAGLKTFQDTTTNDTYEIRIAVAKISALGANYILLSTAGAAAIPTKPDYFLANYLSGSAAIWVSLGDTAIDSTGTYDTGGNIQAATEPFKYRKVGNRVEMKGGFSHSAGVSPVITTLLGTLPSGYRPATKVLVNCYAYGSDSWCPVEINTSGQIYLRADLANTMMGSAPTINTTTGVIVNDSFNLG